jgi:hypothetical protein
MMANDDSRIPHKLRKVYRRLQRWRSLHTGLLPIPEPLWAAAVDLAREHGISPPRMFCIWSMASSSSGRKRSFRWRSDGGEDLGRGPAPHSITASTAGVL